MYILLNLPRSNSKTFKPLKEFENESDVINYIKDNQLNAQIEAPYFFTSIHLTAYDGKKYRVTQSVKLKGGSIPVSPTKLFTNLKSN